MSLTLYAGTAITASVAVHLALEEAGAEYKVVRLDWANFEQRGEAYRKINPKGRVPALVTAHGILTETPALLTYVGQAYPKAKLLPEGAFAFARAQELLAYICATVHPAHAHKTRGARWSDDAAVIAALAVKVPQNMAEAYALLERDWMAGPWVFGPQYTIADPYLFFITRLAESDSVDLRQFPKLHAHRERMLARPATQKVLAFYA